MVCGGYGDYLEEGIKKYDTHIKPKFYKLELLGKYNCYKD